MQLLLDSSKRRQQLQQLVPRLRVEQIGRDCSVLETIFVLDGLREHAILGETLLTAFDACNQHSNNFQMSETSQLPACVRTASRKKCGGGSGAPRIPQMEEEKLRDDLALADSQYEARENQIGGWKAEGDSQKKRCDRQQESDQNYISFLITNRELIAKYLTELSFHAKLNALENRIQ